MDVLEEFPTGTVRCVFSTAPDVSISKLLAWGTTRPDGERIAVCEVNLSRPVYSIIDDLVFSLAKVALVLWPDWYDSSELFLRCEESTLQSTLDRLATGLAASRQRSLHRPWLLRAVTMCRANSPPVNSDFSPTVQLQQLAIAIASQNLVLVIRVSPPDLPDSTGLLALARSLEWLSREVSAQIVAVLPATWRGRAELDGISWAARIADEAEAKEPEADSAFDEPPATVSPIRGRPHPNSPGEQLLASRLICDALLGPLFQYNMPVTTVRASRYQVDLVWFDGKLVVEIDGYRYHSSRFDFANDRHRDYELQLSGYVVLRLTHESVMADVELAIDKIRDLVKLRLGQPLPSRPS